MKSWSRRTVLLGLAGAAGVGAWAARKSSLAGPPLVFGPGDICRASFSDQDDAVPFRGNADLAYRGTHILTYGALRDLGNAYNALGSQSVVVFGGGCDDGITSALQGDVDFGGLCCPVEGTRAEGLPHLVIAHDKKAVVVHPSVNIKRLSLDQLKAIAQGRIRRWSELGGDDRVITLVVRRHCPEYHEPVREALVGRDPRAWSPRSLFVDTSQQLVESVARFPFSIGVGSWVFAGPLARQGVLRAISLEGKTPMEESGYPLTGPLSLVFRQWRDHTMRPFADFLFSPQGQAIISRRLIPVAADEAGYRPGRMI